MPRQTAGVEVSVRLKSEVQGRDVTLFEDWPVKQFLKTALCMLPKEERERRHRVIIQYDNGRCIIIENEEEIFGDRIVDCKELILEPLCYTRNVGQCCAKVVDSKKPYSWFYQLPADVQCKVINERDVGLIALCIGEHKVNLMLLLGFTHGCIEIAIDNARGRETNWYTMLLLKWIYRETKRATFKALFGEMRKIEDIHPGAYDWEKIRMIMSDKWMVLPP